MRSTYRVQVPAQGGWATVLLTAELHIAELKAKRLTRQYKPHRLVRVDSYGEHHLMGGS